MDVVDDRELMRFWLQCRYEGQGFHVHKLAEAVNVTPGAVGHWLRKRNPVHPKYWPALTQFFGYTRHEELLDEARALMKPVEAFTP